MTLADIALTVLLALAVLVVVAVMPVMLVAIDWMCWKAGGEDEGWYAPDQWAVEQVPVLSDDGDVPPAKGGFDVESLFGFLGCLDCLDILGDADGG